MKTNILTILFAPVLVMAFCIQVLPQTSTTVLESKLKNTQWRLESYGASGVETKVVEGTTITIKFSEDGRASGSTGCNSYGGEFHEYENKVTFGKLMSTRRACIEPKANAQEQKYLASLESAAKFEFVEDRLTIYSGDAEATLSFVKDSLADSEEKPCNPFR